MIRYWLTVSIQHNCALFEQASGNYKNNEYLVQERVPVLTHGKSLILALTGTAQPFAFWFTPEFLTKITNRDFSTLIFHT